jgi:hypothetical protein
MSKHTYVSTACQHGVHTRCARTCKYGGEPCQCVCGHTIKDEAPLIRQLAAALKGAVPDVTDAVARVVAVLREMPPSPTCQTDDESAGA